jgi:glycosyltransferase involved in cell wall biosynthesis
MRVLYVTNGFPYPLSSGLLRHYHFIRLLAADHRITLLALTGADHVPAHRAAIEPFVDRIETFPTSTRRASPVPRAISRIRRIAGVGDAGARRLAGAAATHVARGEHDVVVFSGRRTAPAFAAIEGRLPIVADLCDATSARLAAMRRFTPAARRIVLEAEIAAMRRVEHRIMRGADRLLFASERDRALLLGGRPDDRAMVVPNGVDHAYWRRGTAGLGRDEIVFTGRMDYLPNTDAAAFLVRDVLPHVRRAIPGVRVTIVGADPTREVRDLGREAGVAVTGRVDDVRPFLERAAVFACPLRFGVGIQNKLLEAMAMEVPVVSTSVGADGLRIDGTVPPIDVADDAAPVAAALVRRLEAVRADPTPDRAAREFVVRTFSWERAGGLLASAVEGAVDGARA